MQFIEWCDLFLIGHQTIDKEHQFLFEIVNKFHREVYKGLNRRIILETLNQLVNYVQKHFASEEAIAEKIGVPAEMLTHHREEHERLIMDIFKLNEEIASGKISTMHEIERFLSRWLVLHILIEDKKYRDYLLA